MFVLGLVYFQSSFPWHGLILSFWLKNPVHNFALNLLLKETLKYQRVCLQ